MEFMPDYTKPRWWVTNKLLPIHIANYHFDGYIKEDKLLFDYRLKQGTCESFNALVLMKKMGIHVQ